MQVPSTGMKHEAALKILTDKKDEWERLAQALLEYETLSGEEIQALMRGETISKTAEVPVPEERKTKSSVPEV